MPHALFSVNRTPCVVLTFYNVFKSPLNLLINTNLMKAKKKKPTLMNNVSNELELFYSYVKWLLSIESQQSQNYCFKSVLDNTCVVDSVNICISAIVYR